MPKGDGNRGKGKGLSLVQSALSYEGDDCLIWPMTRDTFGYGLLGCRGRVVRAHRLVCELAHGDPPTNKHQAAHSCGKGHDGCYSSKHLSWKTNSENQIERRLHGNKIERDGPTRVTPEQVAYIQATRNIIPTSALAVKMGLKRGVIRWWRETMRTPRPLSTHKYAVTKREKKRAEKSALKTANNTTD